MDDDRPEPDPPPSPALRADIDGSPELALAREWVANAATRGGERESELAANAEAWAELLDAWHRGDYRGTAEEFELDCLDYLDRSIALGEACDREAEQRFAVFRARIEARYIADRGND